MQWKILRKIINVDTSNRAAENSIGERKRKEALCAVAGRAVKIAGTIWYTRVYAGTCFWYKKRTK